MQYGTIKIQGWILSYCGVILFYSFSLFRLYLDGLHLTGIIDSAHYGFAIDDSDVFLNMFDKLRKQKNIFYKDDVKYVATNKFNFYKIMKYDNVNKEVVYQTPLWIFFLNMLVLISAILFTVLFLKAYSQWIREGRSR